ncbi:phosphoribosyltransferase [Melioribacter sp. OK-6-Me]|uniref:phosphoribosyltransferase n=1 Tax=unclassified Melioribacter TaxID=2627329 RepID=UPI003EDA2C3B
MRELSFSEISERIKLFKLPAYDTVVGIREGGVVPASLIAYKLNAELITLKINFRDNNNQPIYETPKILSEINKNLEGKKILIVDDVSVTGKTLVTAKSYLKLPEADTLVMKGKADYVIFPEIDTCVIWPWK